MARISPEDVEHTADLARLDLDDAERAGMVRHLDRVLDHVAVLEGVDTQGIEPTAQPLPLPTPLRPDVPEPPLDPELAVANAPERAGTAFVVPKVIDDDAGS